MSTPLDALKIHMSITDGVDDAALQQCLDAAKGFVDEITGDFGSNPPAPVAHATRMIAAHLFENREASLVGVTAQEVPFGVWALLDSFRFWPGQSAR